MKLFIIDFSKTGLLASKLSQTHFVFTENEDGRRAYKLVEEVFPDIILINYSVKPSHGRQTALAIGKRKITSGIPIYFVDGNELNNKKVEMLGKAIQFNELECLIAK